MDTSTGKSPETTLRQGVRRQQILDIATRLFRNRNYHETSLDHIAAEVGFTKPAIYYYFESKEAILFEIHRKLIEEATVKIKAIASGEGDAFQRMDRMLRMHLIMVLEQRDANKVFYEEQGLLAEDREAQIRSAQRRYERIFREVYIDGVAEGLLRDVEPSVAVATLLGACAWSYRWYRDSGRLSQDEVVDVVIGLLSRGFGVKELEPAPRWFSDGITDSSGGASTS